VLESVEDHMLDGTGSRQGDGHSNGVNVLGVLTERFQDGVFSNGENLSGVNLTVVEDLKDLHLVLERSDLELFEETGLTGGDLVTLLNDHNGVDNFDLTFDNLGLNVQSLEEGSLLGVHTGGTSGDGDISGGGDTNLGGGTSDLGVENLLDGGEVTVGEDKAGVQDEMFLDDLEMGAVNLLLFISILELLNSLLHEGLHTRNISKVWSVNLRSFPCRKRRSSL
jgi:hypothetical protein